MSDCRFDVLALGDAVVDILAEVGDEIIDREGFRKGSMQVVDAGEAARLYAIMPDPQAISGGSAANTIAGVASLGGRAAFVGQLGDDEFGAVFAHDLSRAGVAFDTEPMKDVGGTGRCLIFVTPDAQRTMNTYRGASALLSPGSLDAAAIAQAAITYVEAYLWDHEAPRAAIRRAAEIARDAGRTVAFTLSDIACIERHGIEFREFLRSGAVDILLGNEDEIRLLAGHSDLDRAVGAMAQDLSLCIATRGAQGAIAFDGDRQVSVPAIPPSRVVDTTGAGDLFAAGFLLGHARKNSLQQSLKLGVAAASAIISAIGARPTASLAHLAGD